MRLALGAVLLTLGASDVRAQADHVARCKSEVRGTKIWMGSAIAGGRSDLSARLDEVDIPVYCDCFHRRLRAALGDDLYERSRSFNGTLSLPEMEKSLDADHAAVVACVVAQVGGRSAPVGARTVGEFPNQDKFMRFWRGSVSPDSGIGGLRIGDPKAAMFDTLGPTKSFKPMPDGGEEYYYGPTVTEVAVSISPPPARTVRNIRVSSRFQGQTPGGGRMGDARDRVEASYPGKLAVDLPGYVVYCDGTTFVFEDGQLDSIRAADLNSDVFQDSRLRRCSN